MPRLSATTVPVTDLVPLVATSTVPPLADHWTWTGTLSPVLDRANASLYAESRVKENWIVLGVERQVEVYRRPEAGRYQEMRLFETNDTLECGSIPGLRIVLADLFA